MTAPIPVAWDTVVQREALWFQTDPPATFPTAPPLLGDNGGPFDSVNGYRPVNTVHGKHLYVYRDYGQPQMEDVESMGEVLRWSHRMMAHIYWSFTDPTGSAETMEQDLETAISAVLTRIRGPFGDKTHGGATAGAIGFESVDAAIAVDFTGDPVEQLVAGGSVQVTLRYGLDDHFVG